ncbi:MAG TPA: methyltransferase domain-containing protein [Ktedonobacteraceae bacterium]|jgi:SAM-dependent methyltransferase
MTEIIDMWTGTALNYDQARPKPPAALLDLLTQLIGLPHPALVVDLGSGTGLSTAIWGERARLVMGIEPNADMRARAVRNVDHPSTAHITYREGVAQRTGLPDACADIVTAAQSFHWMEPTSTLAEIARILRPGGLFAAYDYDWPPALNWELEQAYQEMDTRFDRLLQERELSRNFPPWPKHTHLERMRDSGHFRFTRELLLHHIEQGDAARFLEMILTNGYNHHFKQKTITAQEVGFEHLTRAAFQILGSRSIPWYFSYHVRIGIM